MIECPRPLSTTRDTPYSAGVASGTYSRPAPSALTIHYDKRPTEDVHQVGQRISSLIVIESCWSTWLFDEEHHRFRRMLKGPRIDRVFTDWRSYDHIIVHDSTVAFLVFLDAAGTRILRSKRHDGRCSCGGRDRAAEPSPADLQDLVTVQAS